MAELSSLTPIIMTFLFTSRAFTFSMIQTHNLDSLLAYFMVYIFYTCDDVSSKLIPKSNLAKKKKFCARRDFKICLLLKNVYNFKLAIKHSLKT